MAAYASLNSENAVSYKDVKKVILHRYDVNEDAQKGTPLKISVFEHISQKLTAPPVWAVIAHPI